MHKPTEYLCKNCNHPKGKHKAHTLQCPLTVQNGEYGFSSKTIYYPKQYKEGVEVNNVQN